jgi:hypothetical protein
MESAAAAAAAAMETTAASAPADAAHLWMAAGGEAGVAACALRKGLPAALIGV